MDDGVSAGGATSHSALSLASCNITRRCTNVVTCGVYEIQPPKSLASLLHRVRVTALLVPIQSSYLWNGHV